MVNLAVIPLELNFLNGLLGERETQYRRASWLKSEFTQDVWECNFEKNKKTIDFRVVLPDGKNLTDLKHATLLDTLKCFLCIQTHHDATGGKRLNSDTAYKTVSNAIKLIMLMLLEVTGGRCGEIASLTVNSVMTAKAMKYPMLELITLKRRAPHNREIPTLRPDLDMLVSFIEKQRHHLIRKTLGLSNDHGYVFINETNGNPLKVQTISQEMYTLAKSAGIKEKAHAHMFRHRFITKLFVALIEQHTFDNVDDFRRALLDTESMKQKVQQWTGHTNPSSLEIYINLAFEEVSNFKKTYDTVNLSRAVDSARSQIAIIKDEINSGVALVDVLTQFERLLDSFECDLG